MGKTVLVVDDNHDATQIIRIVLAAHGYTVRVAHTGTEALAQIEAQAPDLILLDIMMPDMNGIDVLTRIKECATTTNIPVIMCTAKHEDNDLLEGYRLGADYYITKPFTPQQLLYGVELLLGHLDHAHS